MLSFLTRVYRKLTDIFCWVWLIGFTVFMAIVFNESMDWLFDDWAVFVGVIAGLVIGFWKVEINLFYIFIKESRWSRLLFFV